MRKVAKLAAWGGLALVALAVILVVVWANRPVERPTPPSMSTFFVAGAPLPSGLPPDLQRRVFLDVNLTPPAQVLRMLARTIPCSLELDPRVQRPVTLRVSNVTARTALSAICESVGCRWQLAGTTLKVDATEAPPPIPHGELLQQKLRTPLSDLHFKRVAFGDAVKAISRESGIDITVEAVDPKTPVTVDVSLDGPLIAVLKIIRAAGWNNFTGGTFFGWRDDTLTIRIRPDTKLK